MRYFTILFLMLVFPTANSQENKASGEIVPFKLVEQPPIFEGCENENRECTLQKITDFFDSEFNRTVLPDSIKDTDLTVKIILDHTGALAWQRIDADSPGLEAEAIRSLKELPQLTPAKQNGNEVGVMIDFAVKLSFENSASSNVETLPFPEDCKNAEDKGECLSQFIQKFLFKTLVKPKLKNGVHSAELSFVIDTEGKVTDITIRGENEKLNQSAVTAIKKLPLLTPATKNGKKVVYPLRMPIYVEKH